MEARDVVIDIDNSPNPIREAETPNISDDKIGSTLSITLCGMPISADELASSISFSNNAKNVNGVSPNSTKKEKRMLLSAKKPPKPPRPPRGLSLDAADQKLIKELSELAMIKRARIERMKALKKMRAAKASLSSATSSSTGNFLAMIFTVLFCVVIIFQGWHPSEVLPNNSSAIGITSSPESNYGATEGNIVFVQEQQYLLTSSAHASLSSVGFPNVMELAPGSDKKNEAEKATH